jgi:malonate decarboxylase gamma subunit
MSTPQSRGRIWFDHLAADARRVDGLPPSVLAADGTVDGGPARFLAVVPDPASPFARARQGEVGLREAWGLAAAVRDVLREDRDGARRALVAVVDVRGQAYGRREEMLGIHLACAAAVDAYASARQAGHKVVALLVGGAMSGAFLAHGYQAQRLLALDDPGVTVHAMGREAAARVTRRSVAELDEIAGAQPPMSYRIADYAGLGLLHRLIDGVDAQAPSAQQVERVRESLVEALRDIGSGERDLSVRWTAARAREGRAASVEVRRRMAEQWTR